MLQDWLMWQAWPLRRLHQPSWLRRLLQQQQSQQRLLL
jgi:hypothetical protein